MQKNLASIRLTTPFSKAAENVSSKVDAKKLYYLFYYCGFEYKNISL